MNDADLIARVAKTDAFAPELPLPEGWSSAVAFAQIDRRMDMQTQDRPTETTPVRPPRKGLAVAAAAFVAVLVVGLAIMVLASRPDDASPADTSTTVAPSTTTAPSVTTTDAPTTTTTTTATTTTEAAAGQDVVEEAEALMEDFVTAHNSYDADEWLSLWVEPEFTSTAHDTVVILDEDYLRAKVAWGELFGVIWRFDSCTAFGPRASCKVFVTDAFTEAVPVGDSWQIWGFEPAGAQMADVRVSSTGLSAYAFHARAFQEWVSANHPEVGALISVPQEFREWILTEDVAAAALELLPGYVAELGG